MNALPEVLTARHQKAIALLKEGCVIYRCGTYAGPDDYTLLRSGPKREGAGRHLSAGPRIKGIGRKTLLDLLPMTEVYDEVGALKYYRLKQG